MISPRPVSLLALALVPAVLCAVSAVATATEEPAAPFRRGDALADGAVDMTDAVVVVAYLFCGGSPPQLFVVGFRLRIDYGDTRRVRAGFARCQRFHLYFRT